MTSRVSVYIELLFFTVCNAHPDFTGSTMAKFIKLPQEWGQSMTDKLSLDMACVMDPGVPEIQRAVQGQLQDRERLLGAVASRFCMDP